MDLLSHVIPHTATTWSTVTSTCAAVLFGLGAIKALQSVATRYARQTRLRLERIADFVNAVKQQPPEHPFRVECLFQANFGMTLGFIAIDYIMKRPEPILAMQDFRAARDWVTMDAASRTMIWTSWGRWSWFRWAWKFGCALLFGWSLFSTVFLVHLAMTVAQSGDWWRMAIAGAGALIYMVYSGMSLAWHESLTTAERLVVQVQGQETAVVRQTTTTDCVPITPR